MGRCNRRAEAIGDVVIGRLAARAAEPKAGESGAGLGLFD